METTPQPSACFRECCPFYYLWKSEWYFYILWCSFTVIKKKVWKLLLLRKISKFWVRSRRRSDMVFFPSAASARLRGRLLLAAATLEASLLNTSMLWSFENALKMWGVEGKRTTVLLPLLLEPTPFSPSISLSWSAVLVLTGPLILHFCVRLTADCQHVFGAKIQTVFQTLSRMDWIQNPASVESQLMLVMPECMVKTSLCSSALFWRETWNISLRVWCFSSDAWITAW